MMVTVKCQSPIHDRLSATIWTIAHQVPLSMEFARQEQWSGQPFLSPGDLPNPGTELGSPALQAESLPLSHLGSQIAIICYQSPVFTQNARTVMEQETVSHTHGGKILIKIIFELCLRYIKKKRLQGSYYKSVSIKKYKYIYINN